MANGETNGQKISDERNAEVCTGKNCTKTYQLCPTWGKVDRKYL